MSGNGRADNGRGSNRRRHFRRRSSDREEGIDSSRKNGNPNVNNSYRTQQKPNDKKTRPRGPEESQNRHNPNRSTDNSRSDKTLHADRPKWVPPKMNTEPLPTPECSYCGKPIRDISQAMADKDSGSPVHFDCVVGRITSLEMLDKDDSVTYIGGGRFGVVSFNGKTDFSIKKIIEWENKDKRADWRSEICERYTIL